jgi:hypothetical protein
VPLRIAVAELSHPVLYLRVSSEPKTGDVQLWWSLPVIYTNTFQFEPGEGRGRGYETDGEGRIVIIIS